MVCLHVTPTMNEACAGGARKGRLTMKVKSILVHTEADTVGTEHVLVHTELDTTVTEHLGYMKFLGKKYFSFFHDR